MLNTDFWQGKRVFVTGHTGFKGGWLSLILNQMDVEVMGYSLAPLGDRSFSYDIKIDQVVRSVIGDIRDQEKLSGEINAFAPDIVIHMAAQPLVRVSYDDPVETFSTNVMGTVNILESARRCGSVGAVLNITSDKCYENREWVWGYRECDAMGGHDPYSCSKGCSELVTQAYNSSYFDSLGGVSVASARAGNVIGGGDWSRDRLIPDAMRAWLNGKELLIRNPHAVRPWQHVLEPLFGYLLLIENMYCNGNDFSGGWNFGPELAGSATVAEVVDKLSQRWGPVAKWQVDRSQQPHEATLLRLDISKAVSQLNWKPSWTIDQAAEAVVSWYMAWRDGADISEFTKLQIKDYLLKG